MPIPVPLSSRQHVAHFTAVEFCFVDRIQQDATPQGFRGQFSEQFRA